MIWQQRAAHATREAARLRAKLGYGPADAVCPVDICVRVGLDVWFQARPSMEGLYFPGDPPRVVISSLRPAGRQRYTAGHELGHHVHGHGASLDAQVDDETKVEEFVANRFSRALLMPKLVVANAYSRRGWSPSTTSAAQAFIVAQDLGVGFTTLVDHMSKTLRLTDEETADALRRKQLPKLRAELLGRAVERDLFALDQHWGVRPLDLEVGDLVMAPKGTRVEGACLGDDSGAFQAKRSGIGALALPGRPDPIAVRVSRHGFVGRAQYRHLEDPDDE